MIYTFEIKETLSRLVSIKANSEEEASRYLDSLYIDKGEIVLDADDYHGDNEIIKFDSVDESKESEENNVDYDITIGF